MKYNLITSLYWTAENRKKKEELALFVLAMPLMTWTSMIFVNYIGYYQVIMDPFVLINGSFVFVIVNLLWSIKIDWKSAGWIGLYHGLLWMFANGFYRTVSYAWLPALIINSWSWFLLLYPVICNCNLMIDEISRILVSGPQLAILTIMMLRGYRTDLVDSYKQYTQLMTGIMSNSYP